MFKGLGKLQRELKEAERAMEELDGELGSVSFDPQDPQSIEIAIQTAFQIVDERVGRYSSNQIVGPLIDQIKETYRENLVEMAAKARLEAKDD